MATCSICDQPVDHWLPHPQIAMRSEFMKLLGTVGSDLSVYQCPHCHSTDRDRHLWHYMRAVGLLKMLPSAQLLHIAPERPLELLIEAHKPMAYVRGDLQPRRDGHLKLDVEALPFDDGSFDLIICNHVLEHVADPARALAEFHRCLVPGGVLIAQTPFAPALKNTLELNRPVTPGFARLFYGQEDHVRLFGADIVDLFHAAGFAGEPLSHASVLGEMDARLQGCNAIEPFFAFTR
jgi:SAM-dependent methyltransferase